MTRLTSSEVADQAAEWAARADAGGWTAADEQALQLWMEKDARCRGALLQAQAAWASLEPDYSPLPEAAPGQSPRYSKRALLVGGAAAAALCAVPWLRSAAGKTYRTDLGEVRSVALADGSSVTISSASEIRVNFGGQRREVQLARGEAWFHVAKDANRPFQVHTGETLVQAVGTAFSVRRDAASSEVLVSEGLVDAWSMPSGRAPSRLEAGERATVSQAGIRVIKGDETQIERALAWRSGLIDLGSGDLIETADAFNRYNRRKLQVDDPALGEERMDGVFRLDDPEGFAVAVRKSFNVPIDLADPNVIRLGHSEKSSPNQEG